MLVVGRSVVIRRLRRGLVVCVTVADTWLVRAGRSCCVARSQAELRRTLNGDEARVRRPDPD
jgi:hypothetical protein